MDERRPRRQLVLASTSPRRRELLARLDVEFELHAVDIDETPFPGEEPRRYVSRLAEAKAVAADGDVAPGAVVLAADTTIDLDGEILGKPRDEEHASEMLERLAGRQHLVHTGVAVRANGDVDVAVVTTVVEMVAADRERIAWYVATGEPLVAAGAYQIQGRGEALVASVAGSVSNVIGLPLAVTGELLERRGVTRPRGDRG